MLCSKRARLAAIISVVFLAMAYSSHVWAMSCENDPDCNDGKACTLDLCNGNVCEWVPDSGACQDSLFCNGSEVCDPENPEANADGCAEGTAIECGVGLPDCVNSECSEALEGGCVNTPDDSFCDDGLACNGTETCDELEGCMTGTPACADDWFCTSNECTELGSGAYECDFIPDHTICADSQYCNGAEQCNPSDPAHNALGCVVDVPDVDCDDGFACTVDYCSETQDKCINAADNGYCNDNLFCNGQETCNVTAVGHLANGCLPGSAPDCDDEVGCTDDSCDETHDVCLNEALDSNCDDFNPCTGPDTCNEVNDCFNPFIDDGTNCTLPGGGSGICRSGICTTGCLENNDCNDGLACTVDTCNLETETCEYAPDNTYCDNDLWCDGTEVCSPGNPQSDAEGCLDGDAPNCVDAHDCTVDSCDENNNKCVNAPDNTVCDNEVWCDGSEICSASLGCISGAEPCDDGVSCTVDECGEAGHSCTNTATNSLCDDSLWCNGSEICNAATGCESGTAPDCDDEVGCTDDDCDEDADDCTNVINNGNCEDYNDCTNQYCDAALDCQYSNVDNGDTCQLNPSIQGVCFNGLCQESCTFDEDCPAPACVTAECAGGLCQFTADNAYCNDANVCNGVESCNPNHPNAGEDGCVSTSSLNCNDGIACTGDTCHATNGCQHSANNALCSDNDYCDGQEVCNVTSGCQESSEPDPSCDDGIPCTVDSCDAIEGCLHVPQNSLCQDNLFCNGAEICDELLGCQAGEAPDCADTFACTTDTCDETSNVCRHSPSNTYCGNGLYCDGVETCNPYNPQAGVNGCVPGTEPDCDDGFACTDDSCDEQNDNCYHAPQHSFCDDEAFCNGEETCEPSDPLSDDDGCVPGEEVACNDDVDCTVDECNEGTDQCEFSPDHAACVDNLWCNGDEYCSDVAGCYHASVPNCVDAFACTLDSCDEENNICAHQTRNWLCTDSSVCDGAETCVVGSGCVEGTPLDCEDDWSCTYDTCEDTQGGCVNEPQHTECSDGLACNGEELCDPESVFHGADGCTSGTEIECEDGVSCTVGTCHELPPNGYYCEHEPYDSLCDNDNGCDGIETCDENNDCQDGVPKECNDFVDCTDDSCNEDNGQCVNAPNDANCADNNPCQPLTGCDSEGGCLYGLLENETPCDINPSLAERCLGGFCIPADIQCQEDIDCDDDIECTIDTCTGGECSYQADNSVCQNGQFCDGAEICIPGVGCQDGPDVDCAEQPTDISCTQDLCNELSDSCSHTPINNWCDNGKYCDGVELCDPDNDCEAGEPIECPSDNITCTADICNEDSHSCVHNPDDSVCQDGLYCNGDEVCDLAEDCRAGIAPILDDEIECTIDACEEGANTSDNIGQVTHTPDNSACLNGLYCDGSESCFVDIGCVNGTPPQTSDDFACTADSCSEGSDSTDNVGSILHTPNNALCQNGLYCDGAETCSATQGCLNGTAPQLSDNVDCTTDACAEGVNTTDNLGTITHTPSDAFCQDGLYCNGAETCHTINDCQPDTPPEVEDNIACTDDSCSEGLNLTDNQGSILNTPNHVYCQDADLCNGAESCAPDSEEAAEDGCIAGEEVDCNDEIDCTADTCAPETGECDSAPDDSLCSDDVVCTFDICDVDEGCQNPPLDDGELCDVDPEMFEVCFEGVCVQGCQQDEDCVDQFECTTQECDMETLLCRVLTDDSLCSDDLYCNGEEVCNPELGCQSGTVVDCEYPYTCSYDAYCDEDSDHCINLDEVGACDDDNVCTQDVCIADEGCFYNDVENGTDCGDNMECLDGECLEVGIDGDMDGEYEDEMEVEAEAEPEVEVDVEYEWEVFEEEAEVDGDLDLELEDSEITESDGDAEKDSDLTEAEAEAEADIVIDGDMPADGDNAPDGDDAEDSEGDASTDGDVTIDVDSPASCGGCSSSDSRAWPLALLMAGLLMLWRRRSFN